MKNTIFSASDILLPPYEALDPRFTSWAVIACDQFTSEPSYWNEAEAIAARAPSTLEFFLPEAYLGTPREGARAASASMAMAGRRPWLRTVENSMVYLERILPNGAVRRGLVGKIDLEAYSYEKGSRSPIRATEATVLERIPPRQAIRAEAELEAPHIMILIDDPEGFVIPFAESLKEDDSLLYDFELMLGGGHARGYRISGDALERLTDCIAAYEESHAGGVVYAMGDGNHSLAAAKAHYESLKATMGDDALEHPARYALCEIVSLSEEALVFEPIYRVVQNCDTEDFLLYLRKFTKPGTDGQTVTMVVGEEKTDLSLTNPDHALTVGSLQNLIDRYVESHPGVKCDYIHDEESLLQLAKEKGSVGFLFSGMDKSELFPYVTNHGTLPRKTFSMGEARSKRYYLEIRAIR